VSEGKCRISDTRVCAYKPQKEVVFIIGSGDKEFREEIEAIKIVLKRFNLKGEFALTNREKIGVDAFCDKICGSILSSRFCVAMLSDPVALEYKNKTTGEEEKFRSPRPNVYFEFGLAVGFWKKVIPLIRKDMKLPFDVQILDTIFYNDVDDLKQKLTEVVPLALAKLRNSEKKSTFNQFWDPMFFGNLSIVTPKEEFERKIMSQANDYTAVTEATVEFLRDYNGKFSPFKCNNLGQESLNKNLLLVAGPKPNDITNSVMTEATSLNYVFRLIDEPNTRKKPEGGDIISRKDPSFVRKPNLIKTRNGEMSGEDWGIITKCVNPFNKNRSVIMVTGCLGWGTWACLKALMDTENLKYLNKQKKENFQILVSVNLYKSTPNTPQVHKDSFTFW
jgi:predicted nucleotide-binding protein